jgi:hypothetical protein
LISMTELSLEKCGGWGIPRFVHDVRTATAATP